MKDYNAFFSAGYKVRREMEADEFRDSRWLAHYGIPGQKWGVITKEYEPVTVDHRKIKKSGGLRPFSGIRRSVQKRVAAERQKEAEELARVRQDMKNARANRDRIARNMVYGGLAVAGLIAAYGAYKYVHVRKARAYAGILNRVMEQNPGKPMSYAMRFAEANSKTTARAKLTNKFLKDKGLHVGLRRAQRVYSAKNMIKRLGKIPKGRTKAGKAIFGRARHRMRDRIFDKLYF